MLALGLAQPQRARDRVQHGAGDVLAVALFEAGVVGHADPGQLGQLLAAQPGHPAASAVVGESDVLGAQAGPAGTEELTQFGALIHGVKYEGDTTSTTNTGRRQTAAWFGPRRLGRLPGMTHTTVAAYASPAPKAPLARTTIPRRALGEHDVLIEIKFA